MNIDKIKNDVRDIFDNYGELDDPCLMNNILNCIDRHVFDIETMIETIDNYMQIFINYDNTYDDLICEIMKYISKSQSPNDNDIKYMCMHKYYYKYLIYLHEYDMNFKLTSDMIYICLVNDNVEIFNFIENEKRYNFHYNIRMLEIACKYSNNMIAKILDAKIIPNRKCFINSLRFINDRVSDNGFIKGIEISDIDILSLLIHNGYKITQEDFYDLIKKYIYIFDYKNYDLVINDEIKDFMHKNAFYPYKNISPSNDGLKNAFKKCCTLKSLKYQISQYKIVPDIDYLKIACGYTYVNLSLIKYLVDTCKLSPNLQIIIIAIQNKVRRSILLYLSEKKKKKEINKINEINYYDQVNNSEDDVFEDKDYNLRDWVSP